MVNRILGPVVLCGWLAASASLQAHHSLSAVYDVRKVGKVTGVVTKVAFTNPHGAIYLTVRNPDGTMTAWVMTTGSANALANLGFATGGKNTVKPGDAVTITYFAARNGKPLGFIRSITLPGQREIRLSKATSAR